MLRVGPKHVSHDYRNGSNVPPGDTTEILPCVYDLLSESGLQ